MSVPAPNFTQTPNRFYELLPELSEGETKVGLVIIRATFGWHKERDRISYSQFEALTGMARSTISEALKSLQERGLIDRKKDGQGYSYGMVVEEASSSKSELGGSSKSEQPSSSKSEHTKERVKESDDDHHARKDFHFLTEEQEELYQADLKELLTKYPNSSVVDEAFRNLIFKHHRQPIPRQWLIAQGKKLAEKHGSAEAWQRILAAMWITSQAAENPGQAFMAEVLKTLGKPKEKPNNITPISKGRKPQKDTDYLSGQVRQFVQAGHSEDDFHKIPRCDYKNRQIYHYRPKKSAANA